MLNTTKIKVKSKAFIGIIKSTIEVIGEKYEQNEELEKRSIEEKRLEMESVLRQNDEIIASLRERKSEVVDKINKHQPSVEEQKQKIVLEQQKLEALLEKENEFKEECEEIEREINRLIAKQTKINHETVRMYEEIKVLNESKRKKQSFSNLTQDPFEPSKLAENIRLTLHTLVEEFGERDEVRECIAFNNETIQFRFELLKGDSIENVYYFNILKSDDNKGVYLRKQIENNEDVPPLIATGVSGFIASSQNDQNEVVEASIHALKKLMLIVDMLKQS